QMEGLPWWMLSLKNGHCLQVCIEGKSLLYIDWRQVMYIDSTLDILDHRIIFSLKVSYKYEHSRTIPRMKESFWRSNFWKGEENQSFQRSKKRKRRASKLVI